MKMILNARTFAHFLEKIPEGRKMSRKLEKSFTHSRTTTTKHRECWKASTEKFSEIISPCPLGLPHK